MSFAGLSNGLERTADALTAPVAAPGCTLDAMLHALLARKVGSAIRKSEDVLTASVFGLLGLVDPPTTIARWLAIAQPFDDRVDQRLSLVGGHATITLWPRLDVGDETTAEPDVVIDHSGDLRTLTFIEAKLSSGPSGWPIEDVPRVTGQLGRQWSALTHGWTIGDGAAVGAPHRGAIVYVTADWTMPRAALLVMVEETERKVGDTRFRSNVWWLSWRSLPGILETVEAPDATAHSLSLAVAEYLRALDLDAYRGVLDIARPAMRWVYGGYDLRHPPVSPQWSYGGGG